MLPVTVFFCKSPARLLLRMTVIYWIEEQDLVIIRYPGNLIRADKARVFPGAVEVFLKPPEGYLSW